MPRQKFTHPFVEVFTDLQHGINALVHRADAELGGSPLGSTVVLGLGDELETVDAYVHPHLEHVADEISDAAARLCQVGKSDLDLDVDAQHAAALRAERSIAGDVIATVAAAGTHDPTLPGSSLVDTGKVAALDVAADPRAFAAAAGPAVEAPAPVAPVVEAPVAPVVEAPVVEAPAPVVEQPAAPVVEAPAVEAPAAS